MDFGQRLNLIVNQPHGPSGLVLHCQASIPFPRKRFCLVSLCAESDALAR